MPDYIKEVLDPRQVFRVKTLDRFLSYFGTGPRRLNEPGPVYLLISIKAGDGFCYIDNSYVPLTAGSLLLVSPYSFLHLANAQYLLGCVVIFTEPFFCGQLFFENLLYKTIYEPKGLPVAQLAAHPEKLAFVDVNMGMLRMEYWLNKNRTGYDEGLFNSLSAVVLTLQSQQMADTGKSYDPHNQYEKNKAVAFIKLVNRHYKEGTGLGFYATKMSTTVSQLNSNCKKGYGWAPKLIIQGKIIAEAKRLLAYDPRPISDIGFDLGFGENTSFNAFFRRLMKMSPFEYRSKYSLLAVS